MQVKEFEVGDVERLKALIRQEPRAKQRDRYRIALLAVQGGEKLAIAKTLGLAKSTVETWVYRYRDAGIVGLTARKQPGAAPKLPADRHQEFRDRIINGPRPEDGVCTLRGKDAVVILEKQFGVRYSLPGAYELLHRLGLSCLTPRPRHEKNDQAAMEQFKKDAPFLSSV